MSRPRKYNTRAAKDQAARDRAMRWYRANREKALKMKAKWRRKNKDKIDAYLKANKARLAAYANAYYHRVTKKKRQQAREAR